MPSAASKTWSTEVFSDCYNAIKYQDNIPEQLEPLLGADLAELLVVPPRSEKSRLLLAAAESGKPIVFSNGQEFLLNKPFIEAASLLASELELDEMCCAEMLLLATANSFAKGLDLMDAGRLAFFQRYDYILNIVGYLVSTHKLHMLYSGDTNAVFPKIFASFKKIYLLVQAQNDHIDKQKVTGDINDLAFVNKVTYVRDQLFNLHELLGQLLFSLVDNDPKKWATWDTYSSIVAHINENIKDDSDVLLMHYLPSLIRIVSSLSELSDSEVAKFHLQFVSALSADHSKVSVGDSLDLTKSSMRTYVLVLQFMFFIAFIPWCKLNEARTKKYDFKKDILQSVEWLIGYGTLEQILCYTAESADSETKTVLEHSNLYDFRPLLQRTFPRLSPIKFIYPGTEELLHVAKGKPELNNIAQLCDYLLLSVSNYVNETLLAPYFHIFFSNFINHAAVVLTLLRDNEEDFLLSSINKKQLESSESASNAKEGRTFSDDYDNMVVGSKKSSSKNSADQSPEQGLDLDEIATRADLERFYLACVYTYANRPELCDAFWAADDSNVVGFIGWGLANNTSPLITATFSMFLGSLTSSGEASSARVWDILINSHSGSIKRNDYSKISVDSIINSLTYYADALTENLELDLNMQLKKQQKKQEFLFSSSYSGKRDSEDVEALSMQLSEDSIVFIAGFTMLISFIVKNANKDSPMSRNLRLAAFNRFHPIIISFLKFDNLITSAKVLQAGNQRDIVPVLFNDENRTVIVNLMLNFLADFVATEDSLDIRYKIWVTVDRWISHSLNEADTPSASAPENTRYGGAALNSNGITTVKSELTKLKVLHRGVNMKHGFKMALTNLSEVTNFVRLMSKLLAPMNNDNKAFKASQLLYPSNLGASYRYRNLLGVWPYVEYLTTEVFAHSISLRDEDAKMEIQNTILHIIRRSLKEVDWKFLNDVAPSILLQLPGSSDICANSELVTGENTAISYNEFVRLHHSLAILNYLFDDKTYKVLFNIINIGSEKLNNNDKYEDMVTSALEILNQVLEVQGTFIGKLLPLLGNSDAVPQTQENKSIGYGTSMSLALVAQKITVNNLYYPSDLGTKGVANFDEVILFNLPSVAHIALYAGNENQKIADSAIKSLDLISRSSLFVSTSLLTSDTLLQKNRLLSVLESIDESVKIQYGFVLQIEAITDSLQTKYSILKFIIANLLTSSDVSLAHFLLGFEIKADKLELSHDDNSILLLRSILSLLLSTLDMLSEIDYSKGYNHQVGVGPARLTCLIMEIVVKLCQNPISSRITLSYLRQFDLFTTLLTIYPKIDDLTIWHDQKFNGDVQDGVVNEFLADKLSCDAFFSFISYRNSVLQYLSLEFHDVKLQSTKAYYINLMLDGTEFLNGTPKVLNFLDVLNYQFYNFEGHNFLKFEKKYDMHALLLELKKEQETEQVSESVLSKLIILACKMAGTNLITDEQKSAFSYEIMQESNKVEEFLTKFLAVHKLKALHLQTLRSWVQVIQVLSSDGVANKSEFILKVLQTILPRINNDYYERDILFAEELISLCVLLFDLFEEENCHESSPEDSKHHLGRLLPLFKTCVNGVLCSNSSANLRSDLYLLLNKFLQRSIKAEALLHQILGVLRSIDRKFIDIICNDSIYSEGAPRITSIIFLESLTHLSCMEKLSSILDSIVKNNSLSLLVRSLKRTDEIMAACDTSKVGSNDTGIRVDTLLYELTAFKSTLYLLIRIAQTRVGASHLIQNEIFPVLRQLKFLSVDADLGLDMQIDISGEHADAAKMSGTNAHVRLNLALDIPLTLRDPNRESGSGQLKSISYYEFLVPAFQLVATVLLSMGPSYKPGLVQATELMAHFNQFVVGIMKRDTLLENKQMESQYYEEESISYLGLKQLVKLFTLVDALLNSEAAVVN